MSNIAQQIFAISEKDKNAIITIKTAKGLEFTGKIILLDHRSIGIEQENDQRELLFIRQILEVTEVVNG